MLIVYRMVIKKGREEEFKKLAKEILIPEARKSKGCLLYFLYQELGSSNEFILYERWTHKASQAAWMKRLLELLGPSTPPFILPDKLRDFLEKDEDIIFE